MLTLGGRLPRPPCSPHQKAYMANHRSTWWNVVCDPASSDFGPICPDSLGFLALPVLDVYDDAAGQQATWGCSSLFVSYVG